MSCAPETGAALSSSAALSEPGGRAWPLLLDVLFKITQHLNAHWAIGLFPGYQMLGKGKSFTQILSY